MNLEEITGRLSADYMMILFTKTFVDIEPGLLELFEDVTGVRVFFRHGVCIKCWHHNWLFGVCLISTAKLVKRRCEA